MTTRRRLSRRELITRSALALGAVALAASASLASDRPFIIVRGETKEYGTAKRIEGPVDCLARRPRAAVDGAGPRPLAVVGVRRHAEADDRVVRLVVTAQKPGQPGRPTEHERKEAGRGRIERAGVADAPFAEGTPHARDDLMGSRAGRFVNEE